MDERAWRLPGPKGWLERAVARLADGIVMMEVPPSRSRGLMGAFESAATAAGFGSGGFIEVDAERLALPPASAILESALPPDARPPEASAVTVAHDLEGMVVWLRLDPASWRRWSVFAGAFLTARATSNLIDPPSIVILAPPGAPALDKRAELLRFEGAIGRDDASLVFAEHRPKGARSKLERLLAAELTIELAGWDLDLVKELAALKLEQLLDPVSWANGRYANATARADWTEGTFDEFDGRPFPSFTSLVAAGETAEIEIRIWRAQVRGLFPWLEDVRQSVVDRNRGKFRLPLRSYDDSVITAPEDLDWGQIQFSLKAKASQPEMDFYGAMKRLRNQLAHRRPASFADLVEADRQTRQHLGNT